jgi:hypothetical protein
MLFDLRGRGRRRTVQIVYLGLALLFLLGFVGFGVGVGGGGGGIISALTEKEGSNSASFASKVAAAQKRTQRHPGEAAAWEALAEAQLHQASEGEYFSQTPEHEQYTAKGRALIAKVAHSWNTYIQLEAHHPNAELAQRMASIFSEQGLNQPASAARALQIAIAAKPPSVGLYSALAEYAYKASHLSEGDAAARKAVSLAPAAERKRVKTYLAELRKNPLSHTPTTVTKNANGTYVATQNGKTFAVKPNGNGSSFSGTVSSKSSKATTTAPAGNTSSTKQK